MIQGSKEYIEGYKARLNKVNAWEGPYMDPDTSTDRQFEDWLNGWVAAREEARE